jgi:hypothetical protein
MNSATASWVPLSANDMVTVNDIAALRHPGLPERTEVIAEKLRLFPQGCIKLVTHGKMVGYGVSHPWRLFSIPPLDSFLGALPEESDCLYIHDLAIFPEAGGLKASKTFNEKVCSVARQLGLFKLACVSVYETNVLWQKFGFQIDLSREVQEKIATYGDTAKYMTASIKPQDQ